MGSYTAVPYSTPEQRILIYSNPVAAGDQIILTLDGVDIPYTIQAADLLVPGYFYTQGATNWAAAINASRVLDPIHNLPMNQVVFATEGLGQNVGTKYLLWVGISTRPQFTTPVKIGVRFAPVHSAADAIVFGLQNHTPDTLITVTEPIAAGTVLTTTINTTVSTYTVASGETADSIAGHVHSSLTPASRFWTTRINANTITVINGTSIGTVTVAVSMTPPVSTEKPALSVSGRFLYDRHGNQVILRGVNYAPLDTDVYPGTDYLDEVLQTGANAIRIAWWITYPNPRPAYTIDNLANLLDRCIAANVVPIVEMAQIPCPTDTSPLNAQLIPWWTSAAVVAVLQPRQSCLILNLANELGEYQWADNPAASLTQYVADYTTALQAMRTAGYVCPLMIDAPDCGISNQVFTMAGAQLVAADGNILLSTHAYWAGFDGTSNVAPAVAANLPVIFGEVANKEGDPPNNLPIYDLDGIPVPTYEAPPTGFNYKDFLTKVLLPNQIGWLMWSWFPDDVPERNMSSDGSYASLTAYGQDVVGNPVYGLKIPGVAKPIVP
jgi:mannan endo-1,4-beta-mannosidase